MAEKFIQHTKKSYMQHAADVLPEKVCNFDSVNHCLIFEAGDSINLKKLQFVKITITVWLCL